jgi:PAS domain S-box-containing protein
MPSDAQGARTCVQSKIVDPHRAAAAGFLGGASVDMLATIVRDLAYGVSVLDGEARYVYANPAALRMIGLPATAVIGKRNCELYPNPDSSGAPPETTFTRAVRRVSATRHPERVQTYYEKSDRAYEGDIAPGPNGTVVVCFHEVSEQRRTEVALRASEAHARAQERRYRSLVQASAEIVWVMQADGLTPVETEAWRRFTGTGDGVLDESGWLATIHPDDRERTRRAWWDAVSRRAPYGIEYRLRRADGTYAHSAARAAPVLDDDGQVVEWVGLNVDITDRKLAEEAALRERERFRTALAGASVGMAITDAQANLIEVNASYGRITGRGERELLGVGYAALTHPDDRQRDAALIRRALAGEISGFVIEKRISCIETVWVHDCVSVVRDEAGTPQNLIVISEDITANKLAEAERRRLFENAELARAAAEAANRTKDELLATLSHELKTPVGIMNVWGEVLRRAPDEATRQRAFQAIDEAVRTQSRLVDDLLDASRIASGKITLDIRRTDLHPIIETTIEAIRPAASARSVGLRYLCRRSGVRVMGDADRLVQVMGNILSNAVKFTPDGGQVDVALDCPDAATARIVVSDNGEGIVPELLPHVFEAFRQGDSTSTRRHGGLGLGLAIVAQLVRLQNGTVIVESDGRDQGTTVTLTLPMVRRRRRTPIAGTDVGQSSARIAPGLRILLVDDEQDVREGLAVLLRQAGARVITGDSAVAALREIDRRPPDVLVSDLAMPAMDGYSLIRSVRAIEAKRGRRLAAIALTAYETEQAASRAIAAGFDLHLSKSVPFILLIEAITRLSAGARQLAR